MVTELKLTQKNLYDIDYNLWVLDTVKKLKVRDLDSLDWDNLIEEVEDLSRRDKKKLKSLLKRLCEHLLKLTYWESERERCRGHWQREITNFRQQIRDELRDSPSLKPYVQEIFNESYHDGRELASKNSQLPLNNFPEKPIADLEQILDQNWLP